MNPVPHSLADEAADDSTLTLPGTWTGTWIAGPAAGTSTPLAPGRHLVGRAPRADVRCDDPDLQPHHAILDVSVDGRLRLTQLTGRAPLRVRGATFDGAVELTHGDLVEIGESVLDVRRSAEPLPAAACQGATLVRAPRALPTWQATAPAPPDDLGPHQHGAGGLTPALVGLAGAGAMAAVLHQPMFLWFGALGAAVGIVSWLVQRVSAARRRRAAVATHRDAMSAHAFAVATDRATFEQYHLAVTPTVVTASHAASCTDATLWHRRPQHGDAFRVSVGIGDVAVPLDTDAWVLHDAPVAAELGPGERLALHGPPATTAAAARSLLVQLAASCGPADLRVVVVTPHPQRWQWLHSLPHCALPDGGASIVDDDGLAAALDELRTAGAGHVVLVADHPPTLAMRTSALRRALADDRHALLAVLPADAGVPQLCTAALTLSHGRTGRWAPDTSRTLLPVPVWPAGMSEAAALRCVAALAPLVDPDDPVAVGSRMPQDVRLADLLAVEGPLTPAAIAARWRGAEADATPRAPIGVALDGTVDIDLVRDGPHGLIAGTTGAGKSELLRSLVAGMAATTGPDRLTFVLVDYKGGATFDACAALPHVVGVVTDLDDQLADRALRSLHAELRRRERLLRDHGAADLAALRRSHPTVVLPRLVVVIDEFAALVAEQPDFLHALVGVAQRGRSLGVHLLLATQRPHGVISDDIRANTNLRIALRLHDADDAVDVVGERSPVGLPRSVPGRAVMRLGDDEHVTFQAACCTSDQGVALATLVRTIDDAARIAGSERPPSPWLPPLPSSLARAAVAPDAIGLLDDPDEQRTLPLQWSAADGWTLVAGSSGSGLSATLHTLAAHVLRDECAVVAVLDAAGDSRFDDLAAHPRAVVVRPHERERLTRLLHRLHDTATLATGRRTTLVIDGLDAWRRHLDQSDSLPEADLLDRVLAAGPGGGVDVVVGTHHAATVPSTVLTHAAQRWVLHLHDPLDATALGASPAAVPTAVPGRVLLAHRRLTAQLAEPTTALPPARGRPRVVSVDVVPSTIDGGALPRGAATHGSTLLPVGVDCRAEGVAVLDVPDGDHVLVLGAGRTGRSTALARLALAWRQAHTEGTVTAVLPRRAAMPTGLTDRVHRGHGDLTAMLDELARGTGPHDSCAVHLLVIDDAELVDHPALVELIARPSGLTVLAAGRADALRQSYGHWTGVVRRSRLGLVAVTAPGNPADDGDLLGATLPRRAPVAPRPGLFWTVGHGAVGLTQVGIDVLCATASPQVQ